MSNKFQRALQREIQTQFGRFLLLCSLLLCAGSILPLAMPLAAENLISKPDNFPSSVNWQSLGFSVDGKFYASITYGVEHELNSSESHFFARLQIQHLRGRDSELVLERLLRRSLPLSPKSSKISARSIMLDLLQRESRELYNFQIDPLAQGEVLFSESPEKIVNSTQDMQQEVQEIQPVQVEAISSEASEDGVSLALAELMSVQEDQAAADDLQRNSESPVYIARRNADTTVFYLKKIKMDGVNSLRGQLVVVQLGAFQRRFAFQQSWNSLLQKSAKDLALEPVFVSVSPNSRHLVMTVRVKEAASSGEVDVVEGLEELEQNENHEYATFALAVY